MIFRTSRRISASDIRAAVFCRSDVAAVIGRLLCSSCCSRVSRRCSRSFHSSDDAATGTADTSFATAGAALLNVPSRCEPRIPRCHSAPRRSRLPRRRRAAERPPPPVPMRRNVPERPAWWRSLFVADDPEAQLGIRRRPQDQGETRAAQRRQLRAARTRSRAGVSRMPTVRRRTTRRRGSRAAARDYTLLLSFRVAGPNTLSTPATSSCFRSTLNPWYSRVFTVLSGQSSRSAIS